MKLHSRFGSAKPFSGRVGSKKSLEQVFKNALQSGRLNLSSKDLVELPLQEFLEMASGGVEGVQFWQVVDLRTLDISHNNVSGIPECCRDFQSLEVLNAQHNPLVQWPQPFCELRALRALDCSHCRLVSIPQQIRDIGDTLISLSLNGNQLRDITAVLEGLLSLQILKLSQNQLHVLPFDATWPEHLIHIDLSQNQLIDIPDGMCRLRKLETLDLSKNQITRLPSSLSELIQLASLNVRENNL
jgi:Leucine-rich repeat (LRR) protein